MPEFPELIANSNLEQLAQPPYEALLELLYSINTEARTTFVTAFVLSTWQYANKANHLIKPSLVLASVTDDKPDSVMAAMDTLLGRRDNMDITSRKDGLSRDPLNEYHKDPVHAPESMSLAVHAVRSQKMLPDQVKQAKDLYNKARKAAYGTGLIHHYEKAWHPELDLVTGPSNTTTLIVETDGDKDMFMKHLFNNPGNLSRPMGVDCYSLEHVFKSMQISATLPSAECSAEIVDAIIQLGRPYIILPHSVEDFTHIPNVHTIRYFVHRLRQSWILPTTVYPSLLQNNWYKSYQEFLWAQLIKLPIIYRYPILELVHHLENVCETIAGSSGFITGNADAKKLELLKHELYTHTLRGITLSLAGLRWYGIGLAPPLSLTKARKLLRLLRDNGELTLREVQRAAGFKSASERDLMTRNLLKEGLLTQEGKIVRAVTHADFLQGLNQRCRLPDIPDFRSAWKSF